MLLQGFIPFFLRGKEDERVAGGPAVGLLDKQDAVFLVKDLARLVSSVEKLDLKMIQAIKRAETEYTQVAKDKE